MPSSSSLQFSRGFALPCHLSRFFFYCCAHHRDLHSFPTRRSSDLAQLDPESADFDLTVLPAQEVEVAALLHPHLEIGRATRLNSSHQINSYAVFCLKKKTGAFDAIGFELGLDLPPELFVDDGRMLA